MMALDVNGWALQAGLFGGAACQCKNNGKDIEWTYDSLSLGRLAVILSGTL
jgi:hypothetical protein